MKAVPFTGLAFFAALPCAFAQEAKPALALNIGLVNNYDVVLRNSPVANHYSLGSKIKFVFNDAWFVGYSQLNSIAPKSVIELAGVDQLNMGIAEYAAVGGRKWGLSPKTYALTSLKLGVSQLVLRKGSHDDENIIQELKQDFADSFDSDRRRTSLMAGVEAGLGFKINPYWALEASASYRQHFCNEALLVDTQDLNKVGVGISVVGTLPLQ